MNWRACCDHLGGILGLLQADAEGFLKSQAGQGHGLSDTAIEELISARLQARAEKDWAGQIEYATNSSRPESLSRTAVMALDGDEHSP